MSKFFPGRVVSPYSASIDNPLGNGSTNVLFNLTPTTAVTSSIVDTYGQKFVSFQILVTGSDGNPPHASASVQVCNALYTSANGYEASRIPFDAWTTYPLTSSWGPGLAPIATKQEKLMVELPNIAWRYVRVVVTPTGAGSGSVTIDGYAKQ